MPTQASSAGERGEAGKRKNDCDTQQDTERFVILIHFSSLNSWMILTI